MPLFAIIGRDGAQGVERRKLHREAHLANMKPLDQDGRIRFGGPLRDAAGSPVGSVIIFEAESLEAAQAIAAADPYVTQEIFETYDVFETAQVYPT